jgi:hypothetical protein
MLFVAVHHTGGRGQEVKKDTTQALRQLHSGEETASPWQTIGTSTEALSDPTCRTALLQTNPQAQENPPSPVGDGHSSTLTVAETEQRLRQAARILATGAIRAALKRQQEAQSHGKTGSCERETAARAMSTKRTSTRAKSHHGASGLAPDQLTAPTV